MMTAVWICLALCLALCVGTLFGYCLRAGIERANDDSRPLPDVPSRFPLSPDEKRKLVAEVVSLDERRLRKAGR